MSRQVGADWLLVRDLLAENVEYFLDAVTVLGGLAVGREAGVSTLRNLLLRHTRGRPRPSPEQLKQNLDPNKMQFDVGNYYVQWISA
jgi:hypothetical protein